MTIMRNYRLPENRPGAPPHCPHMVEVSVDDVDNHEDGGEKVEQLGAFLDQTRAVEHVDTSEPSKKTRVFLNLFTALYLPAEHQG